MHVHGTVQRGRQLGQREIVCGDETDRAHPHKRPHDAFGANPAIEGIGPVQNLVEQEQQRHRAAARFDDRPDPQDLRVEA